MLLKESTRLHSWAIVVVVVHPADRARAARRPCRIRHRSHSIFVAVRTVVVEAEHAGEDVGHIVVQGVWHDLIDRRDAPRVVVGVAVAHRAAALRFEIVRQI